jgi:hypothetical protein
VMLPHTWASPTFRSMRMSTYSAEKLSHTVLAAAQQRVAATRPVYGKSASGCAHAHIQRATTAKRRQRAARGDAD